MALITASSLSEGHFRRSLATPLFEPVGGDKALEKITAALKDQRAVFSVDRPVEPLLIRDWAFYQSHYVEPRIFFGTEVGKGDVRTPDEVIQRLLTPPATVAPRRNDLVLLTAHAGAGKTSFLAYLISKLLPSRIETRADMWFVRVDLNQGEPFSSFENFVRYVARCITSKMRPPDDSAPQADQERSVFPSLVREWDGDSRDLLKHRIGDVDKAIAAFEGPSNEAATLERSLRLSLKRLFALLRAKMPQRRPVLILDNPDQHLLRDKQRNASILWQFVSQVIDHDPDLGELGATILLALRPESLDGLRMQAPTHAQFGLVAKDFRFFSLDYTPLKEVLTARAGLLSEIAAADPDDGRVLRTMATLIQERFVPDVGKLRILDAVERLFNKNRRQILSHLDHYAFLSRHRKESDATDIAGRLVTTYPVGILAAILNGRDRFSEEHCSVPNVYAIRHSEVSDRWGGTYWLPRLLLAAIRSTQGGISREMLRTLLCGTGGYTNELVDAVIRRFEDYNGPNVIVERMASVEKDRTVLRVLPRGQLLIEPLNPEDKMHRQVTGFPLSESVNYLQAIADDPWLPLPATLKARIAVLASDVAPHTYSSLLQPEATYRASQAALIAEKAPAVMHLAVLLHEAWCWETRVYERAFLRVMEHTSGRYLPRMDTFVDDRKAELLRVLPKWNISEQVVDGIDTPGLRAAIRQSMEESSVR